MPLPDFSSFAVRPHSHVSQVVLRIASRSLFEHLEENGSEKTSLTHPQLLVSWRLCSWRRGSVVSGSLALHVNSSIWSRKGRVGILHS